MHPSSRLRKSSTVSIFYSKPGSPQLNLYSEVPARRLAYIRLLGLSETMSLTQDLNDGSEHGYILSYDHRATSRLNLQHYLWKEALGYTVELSIPILENAHIADVSTGTALWLSHAANMHPTAHLTGFDLDLTNIMRYCTSEQSRPKTRNST